MSDSRIHIQIICEVYVRAYFDLKDTPLILNVQ